MVERWTVTIELVENGYIIVAEDNYSYTKEWVAETEERIRQLMKNEITDLLTSKLNENPNGNQGQESNS